MNSPGDQSSQQQHKIRQWIKNLLGFAFVALLLVVVVQLITLTRNTEDSRRMLNELTNRLRKTQTENADLKKELKNTKAKVEIILRKFPSAQKVSQARRSARLQAGAGQWHDELSRKCVPEPTDYIRVRTLNEGSMLRHLNTNARKLNIAWSDYLSNTDNENNAVLRDRIHIQIRRSGTYFVYCNLTVRTKYIDEVSVMASVMAHHQKLLSSSMTFCCKESTHVVRLFGLVPLSNRTVLHVRVKYKTNPYEMSKNSTIFGKLVRELIKDRNSVDNTFGVYSVK